MKGLGSLGTGYANVLAAKPPCHVARLVFGEDNSEWVAFYLWKETKAPSMFRKLYNKYSERVAEWLKGKPRLQAIIRNWMRGKINLWLSE